MTSTKELINNLQKLDRFNKWLCEHIFTGLIAEVINKLKIYEDIANTAKMFRNTVFAYKNFDTRSKHINDFDNAMKKLEESEK